MTFEEKIEFMIQDLTEKGMKKSEIAPPVYQLLWKKGIHVKPVHFLSTMSIFCMNAVLFAVLYSTVIILLNRMTGWYEFFTIPMLLIASIIFGLFMTMLINRRRKGLNLPKWEDYGK